MGELLGCQKPRLLPASILVDLTATFEGSCDVGLEADDLALDLGRDCWEDAALPVPFNGTAPIAGSVPGVESSYRDCRNFMMSSPD